MPISIMPSTPKCRERTPRSFPEEDWVPSPLTEDGQGGGEKCAKTLIFQRPLCLAPSREGRGKFKILWRLELRQ